MIRGRAHIEPLRQGKEAIVVTEMPYQVMKGGETGGLIQKIKETVEAGHQGDRRRLRLLEQGRASGS